MADKTGIEWTDATWNPTTGCDRVSPGCDHCYAMTLAKRLKAMGSPRYQRDGDPRTSGPGFGVSVHPDALDQPLRWTKPRRIFVNSMSDLFHDQVPTDYIARVFAVMALTPQHTFQILTKRHARMRSLLNADYFRTEVHCETASRAEDMGIKWNAHWPLPNVWLGVSAEDQKWADIRIPALLNTPAAVRFVSAEPLLGPINLDPWRNSDGTGSHGPADTRLDWVIVGGESGSGARPMHPDWARSLRDQCTAAGVAFLFKQWGDWSPLAPVDKDGRYNYRHAHVITDDGTVYLPGDLDYPDGPRRGEAIRAGHDKGRLHTTFRVGKKAAGRELDGRTWDQYPRSRDEEG